jgi:hypothetical protein
MTPEMITWILASVGVCAATTATGIRVVYTRGTVKQDALEQRVDAAAEQTRLDLEECKTSHANCLKKGETLTADLIAVSGRVERLEGWMDGRKAGKNESEGDE